MSEIVLSGIRATGRLHFGNFLGAVQNFVRFQKPGNTCLYFIADWHTLTTLKDPEELRSNLVEIAKDYLAAGLDPTRSIIYAQSSVTELAELSLYLGMVQPFGELTRIPTYKELVRKNPNNINFGLITYPVLMAADILGPKATLVPVGEDQVPNVELARGLAEKFNARFGKTFTVPGMLPHMVKVPGLDGAKMGKSEGNNAIDINSSTEEIFQRYKKKGLTDRARIHRGDPGNPKKCLSVYPVHQLVTVEESLGGIRRGCTTGELTCLDCKRHLADNIGKMLEPFQEKRRDLENRTDYVIDVLHEGGKRARTIFQSTISDVRHKMGITVY